MDRFDTARLASEKAFPAGATTALLANGTLAHFPDALAGSYLAGNQQSPILLTNADSVSTATDQALSTLGVKNVIILGQTAAVSDNVATQLSSQGYNVSRIGGATRYDTAQAIAEKPPLTYVGSDASGKKTAIVASGENFPDALVSGPMGYASAYPVLITTPTSLSPQTQKTLTDLGIQSVLIPGGTLAVSSAVESQIQQMGITTKRFAGVDRTDTAAQVATYEVQTLGFTKAAVNMARGDDPADSLSGAPLGGITKTLLLLTASSTSLGTYSGNYLKSNAPTLASGNIFGGTNAVSQAVQDEATLDARNGYGVTVTANPSTLPANGNATSSITAAVGTGAAGDPVSFSLSGSPTAACGTLSAATSTTDTSGNAGTTYTASTTAGTCTVTATEANGGSTGSTVITQTPANKVSVTASPASVPATGASPSTITVKVTKADGTTAVSGDAVTFATSGNPAAACGKLSSATATTDSTGSATVLYTSSSTSGFCTISATEAQTGASGSAQITQTSTSSPPATVKATANPSSMPANKTSTSTITATVTNAAGPVSGDPVSFTSSGSPSAACGTLSAPGSTTDASGNATVTYTSSSTSGTCTITATEANSGASGTATVTQTAVTNNVAIAANPQDVLADGKSTSTITAVVTGPTGGVISGDTVTFTTSASPAGACGGLNPQSTTTDSSGTAKTTYTASTTSGFCQITATESAGGASATTTIVQTAYSPPSPKNAVAVTASPNPIPANGTSTSVVTATVTSPTGARVSNDVVTFLVAPSSCGTFSPAAAPTNALGQATVTYTSSAIPENCLVTATEAQNASSGTVTITQQPPMFQSSSAVAGQPTMTVTYNEAINCTTVDSNGSDYVIKLTGGPGAPATIAPSAAACSGNTVTITLPPGGLFQSGQAGTVVAQDGMDGNTVYDLASPSATQPVGDSTTFTVA